MRYPVRELVVVVLHARKSHVARAVFLRPLRRRRRGQRRVEDVVRPGRHGGLDRVFSLAFLRRRGVTTTRPFAQHALGAREGVAGGPRSRRRRRTPPPASVAGRSGSASRGAQPRAASVSTRRTYCRRSSARRAKSFLPRFSPSASLVPEEDADAPRSRVVAARLVGSRRRRNRRRRRSRRLERFGHFQDGGLSPPLPREVARTALCRMVAAASASTANAEASVRRRACPRRRARAPPQPPARWPAARLRLARLLVSASPQRRARRRQARACVLRTAKDARAAVSATARGASPRRA